MKVLSLFDGMACGMLAMKGAGIQVDRYVAFEIDKYAVQTSSHNFPMIEHGGDVFKADFTEYRGFDFLVGGSPCTYWSIAQKNNRETEASGMGWELFSQYVRALRESQPMFFIYENNKSMANAIRESITKTFGFEPVCINSALVSAQNRQRLYWVGKRNFDGTYSRVDVQQPEDRGILLKDILDSGRIFYETTGGKSFAIPSSYYKTGEHPFVAFGNEQRRQRVAEPVSLGRELTEREMDYMVRSTNGKYSDRWSFAQKHGESDKSVCITANISKGVPYNVCCEPVGFALNDDINQNIDELMELCSDNSEIVSTCKDIKKLLGIGSYELDPQSVMQYGCSRSTRIGRILAGDKNKNHDSQQYRVYSTEGKSVTLCGSPGSLGKMTGLYAIPVEYDGDIPTKAISCADGKTYTVYLVKDGQITIKGKQYPIKLEDGFYIIRKLTVTECKRLQTVPEWYEFPVSDTQAYKMLGNGWTVEVIVHLIKATQSGNLAEEQMRLF